MKIYVAQIYIEVGSVYPFTHYFQRLISDELTKRISASSAFIQKYGEDFNLIFRMSAKSSLKEPEVQGPTVFKTDKDVEYTIFLTFDKSEPQGPGSYRRALK